MDTNAVALRALASTVAGAVVIVIGFILLTTVLPLEATPIESPNRGAFGWEIIVLGAMLVQAGLVGFVISGWSGVRATLDSERQP